MLFRETIIAIVRAVSFLPSSWWLAGVPHLHADTISVFTISGTDTSSCLSVLDGNPIPGCIPTSGAFAGAREVDATTGTAIAMDILSTNFGQFHKTRGYAGQ
jgi:hypothetical protein